MTDVPTPAPAIARAALIARVRAAALAMLGAAVRHVLTIAGAALVTRGFVDQGTVDGYMPTAIEIVVGALLAGGGIAWSQLRAYASHTRLANAWAALRAEDPS